MTIVKVFPTFLLYLFFIFFLFFTMNRLYESSLPPCRPREQYRLYTNLIYNMYMVLGFNLYSLFYSESSFYISFFHLIDY